MPYKSLNLSPSLAVCTPIIHVFASLTGQTYEWSTALFSNKRHNWPLYQSQWKSFTLMKIYLLVYQTVHVCRFEWPRAMWRVKRPNDTAKHCWSIRTKLLKVLRSSRHNSCNSAMCAPCTVFFESEDMSIRACLPFCCF